MQVSVVTEMFLDLSLPVSDEVKPFRHSIEKMFVQAFICVSHMPSCNHILQAYRKKNPKKGAQNTSEFSKGGRSSPALTNGNDDIPSTTGSKYQQKKAKKQAKKQAKVN